MGQHFQRIGCASPDGIVGVRAGAAGGRRVRGVLVAQNALKDSDQYHVSG
jgi:hypothetical protein